VRGRRDRDLRARHPPYYRRHPRSGSTKPFTLASGSFPLSERTMAAVAPSVRSPRKLTPHNPDLPSFSSQVTLVLASACLGWEPAPPTAAGVARVQLPTWGMVTTFGDPLSLSKAPADLATSQSVTPFNLRLTGAGWGKPLNEYGEWLACWRRALQRQDRAQVQARLAFDCQPRQLGAAARRARLRRSDGFRRCSRGRASSLLGSKLRTCTATRTNPFSDRLSRHKMAEFRLMLCSESRG
jgi:hypothetical protein